MQEKPHLFQFIPNEKQVGLKFNRRFLFDNKCSANSFRLMQVKLANKLLKKTPGIDGRKKIDGVPVFSAQNLDIAIATTDGIKWYSVFLAG